MWQQKAAHREALTRIINNEMLMLFTPPQRKPGPGMNRTRFLPFTTEKRSFIGSAERSQILAGFQIAVSIFRVPSSPLAGWM